MSTTLRLQTPGIQLTPLQQAWACIDRFYCISLDHRTDRQQQARAQFAAVGLSDRVEFVIGRKHPTNAEHGNYIAQMNCLRAGIASGAQTICIFEDDILFDCFSLAQLDRVLAFLKSGVEWKMFFLGCFVKGSKRTRFPSVINIRFRSTTHAYVIRRDFAGKLLEIPWPGRCFDDLLCSMNDPGMYAVYPAIAFQSNSATDNDKQRGLDRFRRMLGGLRFLQKLNEFSSLNRGRLILVHAIAVVMMLAIVFMAFVHHVWLH